MESYPIYVGGDFKTTGRPLDVNNPYSGSLIASTFLAGKEEVEAAIQAAQNVRAALYRLPAFKRYEVLLAISNELKAKRAYLGRILSEESAKPLKYAVPEIDRAAQTFLIAAEESKRLPKEYMSLDWTPGGKDREGLVKYFPIGLVAGIAPFNFPMNLAVHKIAPAIAAACPIVLKPASSTPLSTLELAKIIDQTELPKGAVSILPMDRSVGNLLVTDERFQLLSFTGSPDVGWKMKRDAGKKKVVLELGGNAGVIVSNKCGDLDEIVKKCVAGGFSYSGQICIHAQRFFVHHEIFDQFLSKFVAKTRQLKEGDPAQEDTEVSSMIDQENAERIEAWLKEALDKGAILLTGGKREKTFVTPAVLTNTNKEMKVYAEEVFGPVVCIERVPDFQAAVDALNASRFGLQAGIFTNDIAEMDQVFNELAVGGVILNDVPTLRFDHMPYGGVKDSGLGREGIRYAIHDMLEPRILVK